MDSNIILLVIVALAVIFASASLLKKKATVKIEINDDQRLVELRIRMRKMGGIAVDDLTNINRVRGLA